MKKISIVGLAACLLLGLSNANAADMSQDNMNMKHSDMNMKKSDAMHKKSMGKTQGMMHKKEAMHTDMQNGTMDKGAMQK